MADKNKLDELIKEMEGAVLEEAKEIYTERTLEEAYNPKNVGELENPSGTARITGPCGDTFQIHLKVEGEGEAGEAKGEKILDCKFLTDGCGASIACGSVVTELAEGSRLTAEEILAVLGGLPEEHLHCSTLATETLKAAIQDYRNRTRIHTRTRALRSQSMSG